MERNGFTKELLIVIIVLGVFTVTMLSTTSYAYKDTSDDYYDQVINVIEKQAVLYGQTLDTLKNSDKYNCINQKDLDKANVTYLVNLARVLNCSIEDILN